MRLLRALFFGLLVALLSYGSPAHAQEQVFGKQVVGPGVNLTFIAAPKDSVHPKEGHLAEEKTDIHLEVLAGWTEEASDDVGAPAGGFVPYLHLHARITNRETEQVSKVRLVPHINRSDNAHYARNVALPGAADDPYRVTFYVNPPEKFELATHRDWREAYGEQLFEPTIVTFEGLRLDRVVEATR